LRIRALREQRGMSLERLGELAGGYNRQTIGLYENGARPATIDALVGIARALGVEPWRLFYG
jgi:transcriptional regulator with XRE-family HTH domain